MISETEKRNLQLLSIRVKLQNFSFSFLAPDNFLTNFLLCVPVPPGKFRVNRLNVVLYQFANGREVKTLEEAKTKQF